MFMKFGGTYILSFPNIVQTGSDAIDEYFFIETPWNLEMIKFLEVE